MPALVEGTARGGTLRAQLAGQWGMGESVAVAGGAGDNAASACGMGTVKPGAAFVSLGTSGVLVRGERSLSAQPRKRGAHILPCAAECLAPDGRHPVGDGFAELAVGHDRQVGRGSDQRARRHAQGAGRASPSCPTSPASARHTMTRRSAALSPVLAMNRIAPPSRKRCSKASPSPSATASKR